MRSTKDVEVPSGVITLKSYTEELLDDTKLAKGVTTRSTQFYGYVRARFEEMDGTIKTGSDSGRVYSYHGATAETPSTAEYAGWIGIAHTYCGEE